MSDDDMTISLKEYFDLKFKELGKQLALRDSLTDKALIKAEESLNMRLEGMNEFRAQLTKQATEFVTHIEFNKSLEKINTEFNGYIEKLETKIDMLMKIAYVGIGIMLVLQIVWKFVLK